jgi:hypothetical protein
MPLATQLLAPTLTAYGYTPDQAGLVRAALLAPCLTKSPSDEKACVQTQFVVAGFAFQDDAEIVALGTQMRETVVPPAMLPVLQQMMAQAHPPPPPPMA